MIIIVSGVSGSGKTSIGRQLACELGGLFVEGDDYHSVSNIEKMRQGIPLNDEDRWPWLTALSQAITGFAANGQTVVTTCSALKRIYRNYLRSFAPDIIFVQLQLDRTTLRERIQARQGHFAGADLLDSQLATLEALSSQEGVTMENSGDVMEAISNIRTKLTNFSDISNKLLRSIDISKQTAVSCPIDHQKQRFIMKTSARNQFTGTVSEVRIGAVNAEVHVGLSGGETIVASITKESVETLSIKTGSTVIALIKAPQIIIITDFGGYKISARNQLAGTVTEVKAGAVNSEIDIELTGGEKIAATVTNDSVESLGLRKGQSATAVFKAGAVLLGVKN